MQSVQAALQQCYLCSARGPTLSPSLCLYLLCHRETGPRRVGTNAQPCTWQTILLIIYHMQYNVLSRIQEEGASLNAQASDTLTDTVFNIARQDMAWVRELYNVSDNRRRPALCLYHADNHNTHSS